MERLMQTASYRHRRDLRSDEVFEDNMKQTTRQERFWAMQVLMAEFRARGKVVEVFDYGVDNTGEIIESKLENTNADYLFIIDGKEYRIEIKTIKEWCQCYTFKFELMKKYVEQKAVMLVPRRYVYYTISVAAIQEMLSNFRPRIWRGFSPNDRAIRIGQSDMDDYVSRGLVKKRAWSPEAREIIEKNYEMLFEEKRK